MRLRSQHPGKMGRPAGTGNNDFDPPSWSLFCIGEQAIRSPVRGDDYQFVWNPEIRQNRNGLF
jgi:hypothetical protein